MSEYISIKEFATRAGVSKQAIYRRIDKDLKSYVKVENGTKSISTEALLLFFDKPVNCEVENSLTVESKGNVEGNGLVKDCFRYTFQVMKEQIDIKDKQLAEKDKQLNSLMELVEELQEKRKPEKSLFSKWFKR